MNLLVCLVRRGSKCMQTLNQKKKLINLICAQKSAYTWFMYSWWMRLYCNKADLPLDADRLISMNTPWPFPDSLIKPALFVFNDMWHLIYSKWALVHLQWHKVATAINLLSPCEHFKQDLKKACLFQGLKMMSQRLLLIYKANVDHMLLSAFI